MEPRAATPAKRLETIRQLPRPAFRSTVLVAPIIPAINDHEIEGILKAAYAAGAREAGYVLLRLPHELKDLMRDWLRSIIRTSSSTCSRWCRTCAAARTTMPPGASA